MFVMFMCINFNYTLLRNTKDTLVVVAAVRRAQPARDDAIHDCASHSSAYASRSSKAVMSRDSAIAAATAV